MEIRIRIEGATPLLMHNPRLADPLEPVVREIKAITSKRKKTDEDWKTVARLEWFASLYVRNGVIVAPTAWVRKCLIETGKISRLGRQVERAISFAEVDVPLEYDGPKDLEKLFANPRFISRLSVVVGGKRTIRVRPSFMPWKIEVQGLFIEDAGLNRDELERILKLAGQVEGLGDNRRNGYGRFSAALALTASKKAA